MNTSNVDPIVAITADHCYDITARNKVLHTDLVITIGKHKSGFRFPPDADPRRLIKQIRMSLDLLEGKL